MESSSDNVIPIRPGVGLGVPTFLDLAQEWLRTEGARLVRPGDVRVHIEHLKPLWALAEGQMRPSVVKAALYALLAPDGPLSPTTVNKVLGTAKRIIREAQFNERWSGRNPFELVRKLKQTRPVTRSLSLSEVRSMLPHLREDRRREALVMLYLGLRPGELKALRREDIDEVRQTVSIHRSNARDSTKTGRPRLLPMPDALWSVLQEAMADARRLFPDTEIVFPARGGRLQREDTKLSRTLKAALRAAGLVTDYSVVCRRKGCGHRAQSRQPTSDPCPKCGFALMAIGRPIPVRWYDLRHSAATLHREAGADPLAVQVCLGHAAENLTDSVYTHLSHDYLRRELNKLKI